MAVVPVIQVGESVLRETADKVENVASTEIKKVICDLIDTMREKGMVGMAAPQVGVSSRIFVSEVRDTSTRMGSEPDKLRVYINPKIVRFSRETDFGWEGCGSVAEAGVFAKVERPKSITVEYLDEQGEQKSLDASGFLARIIQHEYDHLEGILFTDKADMRTLVSREYYINYIRGK